MEDKMSANLFGDARQIAVERAVGEFRAARPVVIHDDAVSFLAFPVEALSQKIFAIFEQIERHPRLIVPAQKVKTARHSYARGAAVRLTPFTLKTIGAYLELDGGSDGENIANAELSALTAGEAAALALARLALLVPAVVAADLREDARIVEALSLLAVEARSVIAFRDRAAASLEIVARSFIPLDGAAKCEFVVFRGGDGFRDQIAVIIGDPSPEEPVLARIHSACLTGDLFASLRCDCGDQLRGTAQVMSEHGGGILLYLDQEGRGNGIANKLRAYCLQDRGFDTFDADEILGFGLDQRRFDFAAAMLKGLGFTSIRLMTNNPEKIIALQQAGLDVVSTHRVLARPTQHNVRYLVAKRDKAGHILGDVAFDGVSLDIS